MWYLIPFSCFPAFADQIYAMKLVLHLEIYDEASTKNWIGNRTSRFSYTIDCRKCMFVAYLNEYRVLTLESTMVNLFTIFSSERLPYRVAVPTL